MRNRKYRLEVWRTDFTLNEVFGSRCGRCGHVSFDRLEPVVCPGCGLDHLEGAGANCRESADGCSIPYDGRERQEFEEFDTLREVCDFLRWEQLTETQDGEDYRNPDGWSESPCLDYDYTEVSARLLGEVPARLSDALADAVTA